jgi:hypothetical protein
MILGLFGLVWCLVSQFKKAPNQRQPNRPLATSYNALQGKRKEKERRPRTTKTKKKEIKKRKEKRKEKRYGARGRAELKQHTTARHQRSGVAIWVARFFFAQLSPLVRRSSFFVVRRRSR